MAYIIIMADQTVSGDRLGLKFPDICLMGERKKKNKIKPKKNPYPGKLSRPGFESSTTAREAQTQPLLHSGGRPWSKRTKVIFEYSNMSQLEIIKQRL